MTVINLTIIESSDEIISGIPRSITLNTNIPASIFYTLDGTEPTLFSSIYIEPIKLPFDKNFVTLKAFATDGEVTSSIITETYRLNILNNTRLPRSATTAESNSNLENKYPFGTIETQPNTIFLNPGEAGTTINDPQKNQIPNGFDNEGNPASFTNETFDSTNYAILYSETDHQGKTGLGIGNLPASVKIQLQSPPPQTSNQYSKTFNPRALVIFQDFSNENLTDPPNINRQSFSLGEEKNRDGSLLYNVALEMPPLTGSFIKSFYNPRDNTITHYYRDSESNRWIISKSPYQRNGSFDGNLANVVMPNRAGGSRFIFDWNPFRGRTLY